MFLVSPTKIWAGTYVLCKSYVNQMEVGSYTSFLLGIGRYYIGYAKSNTPLQVQRKTKQTGLVNILIFSQAITDSFRNYRV